MSLIQVLAIASFLFCLLFGPLTDHFISFSKKSSDGENDKKQEDVPNEPTDPKDKPVYADVTVDTQEGVHRIIIELKNRDNRSTDESKQQGSSSSFLQKEPESEQTRREAEEKRHAARTDLDPLAGIIFRPPPKI